MTFTMMNVDFSAPTDSTQTEAAVTVHAFFSQTYASGDSSQFSVVVPFTQAKFQNKVSEGVKTGGDWVPQESGWEFKPTYESQLIFTDKNEVKKSDPEVTVTGETDETGVKSLFQKIDKK